MKTLSSVCGNVNLWALRDKSYENRLYLEGIPGINVPAARSTTRPPGGSIMCVVHYDIYVVYKNLVLDAATLDD